MGKGSEIIGLLRENAIDGKGFQKIRFGKTCKTEHEL
jgi:hypothetical protein